MLATTAVLPGNADGYRFEAEWDGIRALARIDSTAQLFSRQSTNLTTCLPEITETLANTLAGRTAILDGEIVALDRRARPSFELAMRRMRSTRPAAHLLTAIPAMFIVRRALSRSADVMRQPYLKRRALLDSLNLTTKPAMASPFWTGITSLDMFDAVRELGLEGLVCKRASSTYEPGRRSNAWIKSVVRHRAPIVVGDGSPAAAAPSDHCWSAPTTLADGWCTAVMWLSASPGSFDAS